MVSPAKYQAFNQQYTGTAWMYVYRERQYHMNTSHED